MIGMTEGVSEGPAVLLIERLAILRTKDMTVPITEGSHGYWIVHLMQFWIYDIDYGRR